MFTHILAASLTLQSVLTKSFVADPGLAQLFGSSGTATVSLATPDGMEAAGATGLSMWLYRLIRDDQTLNRPPLRVAPNLIRRHPLPVRLHYLMTPILTGSSNNMPAPESEQLIIGRVLQALNDEPLISGPDLQGSYAGTGVELAARLETLGLDETSRIWEGLERSYQLSVSYEVTVVVIASDLAPITLTPVSIVEPQYAIGARGAAMTRMFPVLDAISGWLLAPDTPPPIAANPQEVLVMTLVDEITGLPPDPPPAASTTATGLLARADADGAAGLAGVPLTLFLATSLPAPLQLTLAGSGFITLSRTTTLPAQPPTYPDAFVPANLDTVTLHRSPAIITGRVVNAGQAPLNNALVTVNGIWHTLASLKNPAASPSLIALLSPLYADRDATATLAPQNLSVGAATKTLLLPGNVGDTTLRLSDQVGLAAGSIIGLDQQDPQRGEYVSVVSITQAGATPQQPATAVLPFPLARPHASGVAALPMTPAAAGAANALALAAQAGDATMFPAAMNGLDATMTAVVISGGGVATAEYHAASLYAANSDINGHVVLPAVHRLAQLQLRVHHPSQATDLLTSVILPFGAQTISLNLTFP